MAEGNGMVERGVAALNAGRCVGEGVSEDEFRLALLAALDLTPEEEDALYYEDDDDHESMIANEAITRTLEWLRAKSQGASGS